MISESLTNFLGTLTPTVAGREQQGRGVCDSETGRAQQEGCDSVAGREQWGRGEDRWECDSVLCQY